MNKTLLISDEYAVVFGMHWHVLDSMESRHGQITQFRERGGRWKSSYKHNGDENFGWTGEIGQFDQSVKVLSGAAQIACMPDFVGKTVLVLIEDAGDSGNDGKVAIVGLINGNIMLDDLLALSEVRNARSTFEEKCKQLDLSYTTVGTSRSIEQVDSALDWDDLLPAATGRFKRRQEMLITPLRTGMPTQYASLIVAGLIVAIAGTYGYSWYTDGKNRDRAALAESSKVDPEVVYAAAAQAFLAQPQYMVKDAFPALRNSIGKLPVIFAGWELKSVSCNTGSCFMEWRRDAGTFEEFKSAAPAEWKNIAFGDDGISLTTQIAISLPKKILPVRSTWIDRMTFKEIVMSQWQRFSEVGLQTTLAGNSLQAVPPQIPPASVESSPNAIRAAAWSINPGSKWYASSGFDSAPEYMTYESMRLTVENTDTSFEARGKVYVKN